MFLPSRWRRTCFYLLVTIVILLGFLYVNAELRDNTLNYIRPAWFYIDGLTRYDFKPTPDEQACLDGNATRINASGMLVDIPKVVHFVIGVDKPNPITLMLWLAIRAAAANLQDCEIRLHYVYLSGQGPWWEDVRELVTLTRHGPEFLDDFLRIKPPPSQ